MNHEIKLYTTPTWPACHQVKEFLSRKNANYTEFDVAKDTNAREEMINMTGKSAVPVVLVDDEVMVGFDPNKLNEILH